MKTSPTDRKRTCLRRGVTESRDVDSHVSGSRDQVTPL